MRRFVSLALVLALVGCSLAPSQYHPSDHGIPKTPEDLTRDMAECQGHEGWIGVWILLAWPALLAASIILEETQRACMAERGWTAVTLSPPDEPDMLERLRRNAPSP